MPKAPIWGNPPKASYLLVGVFILIISVAYPTWKFGSRFLLQFFISPFQFFIMLPWIIAFHSSLTGRMSMRSGPPLFRDERPQSFYQNVWFCIIMGAMMFSFNLFISWGVVSR